MRMFWAEYLTHYGVDGLFATWEKVTILHSPASAALAAVVGARASVWDRPVSADLT